MGAQTICLDIEVPWVKHFFPGENVGSMSRKALPGAWALQQLASHQTLYSLLHFPFPLPLSRVQLMSLSRDLLLADCLASFSQAKVLPSWNTLSFCGIPLLLPLSSQVLFLSGALWSGHSRPFAAWPVPALPHAPAVKWTACHSSSAMQFNASVLLILLKYRGRGVRLWWGGGMGREGTQL